MEIILILLMGGLELLAFLVGARVGQKVVNKEEIKIPTPRSVIKEIKEEKQVEEKQHELDKALKAIDDYQG